MTEFDRHLTIDELLASRDPGTGAEARSHLDSCHVCRVELDRIERLGARLRALMPLQPRTDLWVEVRRRLGRERRRRRATLGAAALGAAALVGVFLVRGSTGPERGPEVGAARAVAGAGSFEPIIRRSQALESVRAEYGASRRVVDAPTALAVSVLEDRLLVIDDALAESQALDADSGVVAALWDERVSTLEALVGLQLVGHRDRPR